MSVSYREIPYNYTSADDRKIINVLFSNEVWEKLELLRTERKTGRSARLLMRIIGELFVYFRNPYLKYHLKDSFQRKRNFFSQTENDLEIIKKFSKGNEYVTFVINAVGKKINELKEEIKPISLHRENLSHTLGSICGSENVFIDPFALICHTTDATDWRLFPPVAVVRPYETAQVGRLLKTINNMGFKAIVRGGGTGLTGGTVPLTDKCIIINTEKLNKIYPIADAVLETANGKQPCKIMRTESGVITEDAMKAASSEGYVFATDPTSAWASTIGGNLSENAGGKSAVKWGTAIDNVLSFEMAMPSGNIIHIKRTNHQYRKILQGDLLHYEITDNSGNLIREITLRGNEIRKPGLWKDITNKALGGLPGLQKEGTDGVILSAEFILYPVFAIQKTFCLEFFGESFSEAGHVILEISNSFTLDDKSSLIALEHFDQEYIKAIQYRVKSGVSHTPKAVLLIDMAANAEADLKSGEEKLKAIISKSSSTEIHTARDKQEAKTFWHDRKQLGAIAKRTNAFKLNEDIVLPITSIAAFCNWIDEINLREEIFIQHKFLNELEQRLEYIKQQEAGNDFTEKLPSLFSLINIARDEIRHSETKSIRGRKALKNFHRGLKEILSGYEQWLNNFSALYDEIINTILIIATHMHAGDGNIHVNIPVFSNDLDMMHRAELMVDEVMEKTVSLGGVVSGEHGIGITKIKYLDDNLIAELNAYRREIDPSGMINPEKLVSKSILNKVFTPSFNLLELEARILKHGNLENLASKIAHCVRCGKCKADCCVFYPAKNMFFHPRNKNLAIGSLIEAVLFEAQRYRNISFGLLSDLEEIADHCTICHKCKKPCPVKIDTGEITILERNLLAERKIKHTPIATRLTLKYLASTSKIFNLVIHTSVLVIGTRMQNIFCKVVLPLQKIKILSNTYALKILQAPMPPSSIKTMRNYLPECRDNQALVFEGSAAPEHTFFYFPGCGSERMFSDISLAALYLMLKSGARIVLPPPFICCGFPIEVNGKQEMHTKVLLRDTILLSQIRDMFKHLNFDAVCITCGTCKEGLEQMGVDGIFGAAVKDVMLAIPFSTDVKEDVLYHKPCHDSLEEQGVSLIKANTGCMVSTVPHCCSEAGTLALSRPDISGAMRNKKGIALQNTLQNNLSTTTMLTNCPSCIQGLSKQQAHIDVKHLTVYMAEKTGGKNWKRELKTLLDKYEKVTF